MFLTFRYQFSASAISLALLAGLPTIALSQDQSDNTALVAECNGKDVAESIRACTTLLSRQLKSDIRSRALFNRGVRLQLKGDKDAALADFDEAAKLEPLNALALSARGTALVFKERFSEARTDLDEAIRLQPSLAAAFTARGLLNLFQGRLDECIADSTEALKQDPRQQAAYNNRGAAYREKGLFDKAIEDFNVVIRQNPTSSRPLYNRGLTYLRQGNRERALLDYNAALVLNPNDTDAIEGRKALLLVQNSVPKNENRPQSSDNATPPKPTATNSATISDPGCKAFASSYAVEYVDGRSDDWKNLFGKSLSDWQAEDITKLREIFESCRQDVPRFKYQYARSWSKYTKDYFEKLAYVVGKLSDQKAEIPAANALLSEVRSLATKAGNIPTSETPQQRLSRQYLSDTEERRLRELLALAREKASTYQSKGYQDLDQAATAVSIATQAISTVEFFKRRLADDEKAKIAAEAENVRVAQERKAESELMEKRIAAARNAGYEYRRFADVVLDKQNMVGRKIAVDGFLTVRGNAAILDFPTVGEVSVDLSGLSLDIRRFLLTGCNTEQARCYLEVRGQIENISTELGRGLGIAAAAVGRTR